MNTSQINALRAATHAIHGRLEHGADIVRRLTDPVNREDLIRRFASLHIPAEDTLAPHLGGIEDLDFRGRMRASFFSWAVDDAEHLPFPTPRTRADALGMLYVLEGSTLGGHVIMRELAARNVDDPRLAFLNPYGPKTGARWRAFLAVLARETADQTAETCRGAIAGFEHAERILCEAAS